MDKESNLQVLREANNMFLLLFKQALANGGQIHIAEEKLADIRSVYSRCDEILNFNTLDGNPIELSNAERLEVERLRHGCIVILNGTREESK